MVTRAGKTCALAVAMVMAIAADGRAFDIVSDLGVVDLGNEGWDVLSEVSYDETGDGEHWRVHKTFSSDLIAAAQDFTISGFVVPVLAEPVLTTFLLVKDPADCPYCGNGGYGPVLEVTMAEPLPDLPEFTEITLVGQLELIADPLTTQAYRMIDARALAN